MINKRRLIEEELEWKREKELVIRKQKLDEEKKRIIGNNKKITTTKWLILFLFLNCTIIEIFTGWTIVRSLYLAEYNNLIPDFTPLVTLIGAVVGEVFGFAIYSIKSAKENSAGGVTYLKAQRELNMEDNNEG